MADTKDQLRLQFELSPERVELFDQLRKAAGFENRKELLNNALTLVEWAIRHARAGHTIASLDEKSDKLYELEMPFLQHVARNR
jgi:hypothetical protein